MVTTGNEREEEESTSSTVKSLNPSWQLQSIDELERRLETTPFRGGWLSTDEAHVAHDPEGELCACLGILCHCDGQDCIGICEAHCVIHYL